MRVDVSSDTATEPSAEMRDAMATARAKPRSSSDNEVGRLQALGADLLGKEAGLYMPTGTQANLVAILSHTAPSQEVLLGQDSHIYEQEVGGAAALAGVMLRTWPEGGVPTPTELTEAIDPAHRFPTSAAPEPALLCLENSHNASGGRVIHVEEMIELCSIARRRFPAVHLDGARIFNAAAAAGVSAHRLADPVDSVSISLDKGLSAPMGALLMGSSEFIVRATRWRRMLGGYMRKAEIMAAAGVVALERMVGQLELDNRRAARIGEHLVSVGLGVQPYPVQTNLLMLDTHEFGIEPQSFVDRLDEDYGILAHVYGRRLVRLAIHRHVRDDEEEAIVAGVTELAHQRS
ncbi:MAG: GntG family PLP-dependent aldolase [Candidatus Latescibacterota bacterium]|nr:GntG family PLP-dependent aldolase [Candidatus Latescibacterota bacterium]